MNALRLLLFCIAALVAAPLLATPAHAAPADSAAHAAELAAVEATLRDPATSDAAAAEAGHRQQGLIRAMAIDASLEAAVVPLLPEPLRAAVAKNVAATREIRGTVGGKRTTLPAWNIVPALSLTELRAQYDVAAAELSVPWEALAAIHLVETRMGRLRGVSSANARGPMQFIPETWARFGKGDILNSQDAILAAARHLSHHGAKADLFDRGLDRALYNYNPTDRYVKAVRGYAELMRAEPALYRGYWGWQVYYETVRGQILLPEGYAQAEPIAVSAWCAETGRCPG